MAKTIIKPNQIDIVALSNDTTMQGNFVSLSGDTMTGNLTIGTTAPVLFLNQTGAAVNNRLWSFYATSEELRIQARTDASGGGGNYIAFERTDEQIDKLVARNAGVNWLEINNSTKKITSTSTPVDNSELTRKDYVDTKQTDLRDVGTVELNSNGSGDRNSFIDFHSSDDASEADYSARIIRTPGINADYRLENVGTGNLVLITNKSGANGKLTLSSAGNVSVSATAPSDIDQLTRKDYVDDTTVSLGGDTMTGVLQIDKPVGSGGTHIEMFAPAAGSPAIVDVETEFTGILSYDSAGIELGRYFSGRLRHGIQIRDNTGVVESSLYLLPDANVLATAGAPGTDFPATPTLDTHLTNKKYVDDNYLNLADTYYAGHHAEGRLLASAALTNDLANARLRGSIFSFTNISPSDDDIDNMFDGLSSILNLTVATTTWPIVIEFTVPRTLKWGTTVGIGFGAEFWYCESVKIEAFSEGGWVTCIDTTTNASEDVVATVPGNSSIGVTSLRYTLDNAIGTSMRIAHLWGFNYDSDMWSQLQMPRAGGTMYGPMTIESATPSLITRTTGTTGYHAWSIRDSADIWRMQLGTDLTNNNMKLIYTDGTGTQKCRMELTNDGLASVYNAVGAGDPTTPTGVNNLTPKKYVDDTTVALDGDTMTGDLIISSAQPALKISETGVTANNGNWSITADAESLLIQAYNDTFTSTSVAIQIHRTDTLITSTNIIKPTTTNTPTEVNHLTRKDYVDKLNLFNMQFLLPLGSDDTYTLLQSASFGFTIDKAYFQTASGTITGNVKIDGTSVTGLSILSISSTEGSGTASAANTVSVGGKITLVTTANSSATMVSVMLECTRT